MGKKNRVKKVKVPPPQRTKEERQQFANTIREKMGYLGISHMNAIKQLYSRLDLFVESGLSDSGKIKFPEDERRIEYLFTNNKHIEPYINMKKVS